MWFATTRWSMVLAAGAGSPERADQALAELCAGYWYPLYAYARRRGYDADDACYLTQAFFARLIEQQKLTAADPVRGRFRSFLLTSMKNFLASEWRRQAAVKRGGGADVVSTDATDAENRYLVEPADNRTPEADYERRWALALIQRAVEECGTGMWTGARPSCSTRSRRTWASTPARCRTASCPGNSSGARPPCEPRSRGCAPAGGPDSSATPRFRPTPRRGSVPTARCAADSAGRPPRKPTANGDRAHRGHPRS